MVIYQLVFFSHYLYSISYPNKFGVPQWDLSGDEEAKISDIEHSLSFNQSCTERVIVKLFTHYKCDVMITDRLRSLFTNKLIRMGKAIQAQGGPGRKKLLDNWRESYWLLKLKQNEIIRKRKPDNLVVQSCKKKCEELEVKIKETENKLKDVTNKMEALKKSNQNLSQALITKNGEESSAVKKGRSYKSWEEYSPQYMRIKKRQFASDVVTALSFTEDRNFKPMEIEFLNKSTGERLRVDSDGKAMICQDKQSDTDIQKILYIKEKYQVSNKAYHELAMINPELPRSCTLIKAAKDLDLKSTICRTPGKAIGVQQSVLERLKKAATWLMTADPSFCQQQTIKVKITGDGTNISRSMHCVIIAFTIIHDSASPNSPRGNHTVAILNTTENYDTLAESLVEVSNDIKMIREIEINEIQYAIEWFFTADLKFLALCGGIEAANSRFACVWCKCPSEDRFDVTKEWSVRDIDKGARTINEIQTLAKLPKSRKDKKYGCVRQPVFPYIPVDHIIPDTLHLFLRVTDVLINLLIRDLRRLDALKNSKSNLNIDKYITFLKEKCKISFHIYHDKESKELKWRDLTGPEKIRLFEKVDLEPLFPEMPNVSTIQSIWKKFYDIYKKIQSSKPVSSTQDLRSLLTSWISLFTSIYQTKNVTPYIHVLITHIPEFLDMYGTIVAFSQQGLEKLNDEVTQDYFRSTNHRDGEAQKQLLLKLNRLEEMTYNDCSRKKQTKTCRICRMSGHNSRTCKNIT